MVTVGHFSNFTFQHISEFFILDKSVHYFVNLFSVEVFLNDSVRGILIEDSSAPAAKFVTGWIGVFASRTVPDREFVVVLVFLRDWLVMQLEEGVVYVSSGQVHIGRSHVRALDPSEILIHLSFCEEVRQVGCPAVAEVVRINVFFNVCTASCVFQNRMSLGVC